MVLDKCLCSSHEQIILAPYVLGTWDTKVNRTNLVPALSKSFMGMEDVNKENVDSSWLGSFLGILLCVALVSGIISTILYFQRFLWVVIVCKGYHNKMPQAGWLKQQICFLIILEAKSSRSRYQQVGFLRRLFLDCRGLHALSSHGLSLVHMHVSPVSKLPLW